MSINRNLKELFYNKYGFNRNTNTERQMKSKSPLSFSQFQSFFQFAQTIQQRQNKQRSVEKKSPTPTKVKVIQFNADSQSQFYHTKNKNHSRNNSLVKHEQKTNLQKPAFYDNSDIINRNTVRQQSKSPNTSVVKIAPFLSQKYPSSQHIKPQIDNIVKENKPNDRFVNEIPQITIQRKEKELEQKNSSQHQSGYKLKGEFKSFENIFQSMISNNSKSIMKQNEIKQSIYEPSDEEDEALLIDNYHGVLKRNFVFHYVIGKGGFGKVWKVELKKNRQLYAMKEMSKAKIIAKRSVNSVMNERNLLSQLKHPFMVNMTYSFQDRDNLYLVMDLLTGGDLRYHIGKMRRFKEHQTKFFVACVILSLEYLHNNNVIHRDLKPENLVVDNKGYVRLTDLGIARIWKAENSCDTSGTPGYMAPEVMCRQNHTIAVDYFALGVITYEFMLGRRPYSGRSRQEIRDQILTRQVQVKKSEIPDDWSLEAADFVNKLLQRKPINRLGFKGPDEVKNHPWLRNYPWQKLLNKEIDSPYIPMSIEDNVEYLNQISEDNDSQDDLIKENIILLRKNSVQNLFSGYSYDYTVKNTKSTSSTMVMG